MTRPDQQRKAAERREQRQAHRRQVAGLAYRLRQSGLTYREIGAQLGVCAQQAWCRIRWYERVQRWHADRGLEMPA